jgi:xylulokinase
MIRLFAGLDVSTQGCKLVVIDDQAGNVVHVDAVDYDRDLPEYRTSNGVIADAPEGVSESDPTMWIAAVELVLGRLAAAGCGPTRSGASPCPGSSTGWWRSTPRAGSRDRGASSGTTIPRPKSASS